MVKEQDQIRKLIGKICDACLRINLETKYAAFVNLSGHVSLISGHVVVSKADFNNEIMSWDAYYKEMGWNTTKEIIKNLSDCLAALEKFLKEAKAK